ncbi:MAG TPA: formyltransferase family protein, partial [Rhodanobacteraceae bacterium]|nr:formyltransferase family protein [Rhodanobacteraceae bacterium]
LEHGASVHFVSAELDGGPVIAQARIAIHPGDTEDALAARLLSQEHRLLIACVDAIARGTVREHDGKVLFNGTALSAPLRLGPPGNLVTA